MTKIVNQPSVFLCIGKAYLSNQLDIHANLMTLFVPNASDILAAASVASSTTIMGEVRPDRSPLKCGANVITKQFMQRFGTVIGEYLRHPCVEAQINKTNSRPVTVV